MIFLGDNMIYTIVPYSSDREYMCGLQVIIIRILMVVIYAIGIELQWYKNGFETSAISHD